MLKHGSKREKELTTLNHILVASLIVILLQQENQAKLSRKSIYYARYILFSVVHSKIMTKN